MKNISEEFSEQHKSLGKLIRKKECVEEAKKIFFEQHGQVHRQVVSNGTSKDNIVEPILDGLQKEEYSIMPTSRDDTIAWSIWHIARIEDLTMNILIAGKEQLFTQGYKEIIHGTITDTGNALTDEEIMSLSKSMDIDALLDYWDAVGRSTREIVKNLTAEDLKTKVSKERLQIILNQGGVTKDSDSIWLLDFWGKKTYGGLLLMPPTYHEAMHLNSCIRMKEAIRRKKKYFMN